MRFFSLTVLAVALAAAACSGSKTVSEPDATTGSAGHDEDARSHERSAPPPAPVDCANLDSKACLLSRACTLAPEPRGGYVCRATRPPCETAALQIDLLGGPESKDVAARDAALARCRDTQGCTFTPGNCFCYVAIMGLGVCVCGGGPPPVCTQTSAP